MGTWSSKWYYLVWAILGFVVLLSGVGSGNVVTMVAGTVFTSSAISYVRSEHRVKRALEVLSALVALNVVIYGYAITGSLVLGVITFFILVVFFFAFVASYLLPKIRGKSKSYG